MLGIFRNMKQYYCVDDFYLEYDFENNFTLKFFFTANGVCFYILMFLKLVCAGVCIYMPKCIDVLVRMCLVAVIKVQLKFMEKQSPKYR